MDSNPPPLLFGRADLDMVHIYSSPDGTTDNFEAAYRNFTPRTNQIIFKKDAMGMSPTSSKEEELRSSHFMVVLWENMRTLHGTVIGLFCIYFTLFILVFVILLIFIARDAILAYY